MLTAQQRACDRCHRNACRCSPGIEGTVCARCEEQKLECTYSRPVKRRGPSAPSIASIHDDDSSIASGPPAHAVLYSAVETFLKPDTIYCLIQFFHRTIYPIRPYFHWPTFEAQVRGQEYRSDWGIYVVTMAVCALAAGRVHGCLAVSTDLTLTGFEARELSLRCYAAAVGAIPLDVTIIDDYCQAMKASALLASACLQNGDMAKLVAHMTNYFCLSTIHKFDREAFWPNDLNEIQRQERRRLFWCVYQQERYLSINFDLPTLQAEGKATVLYPAEVVDDEDITATGLQLRPDQVSFLRGWNFCTDMYRLQENMDRARSMRKEPTTERPESVTNAFLARIEPPKGFLSESLQFISKMHSELPPRLRAIENITGDLQADRCRLVASNIILTTQNLKMYLVGREPPNLQLRCSIASELLDELSAAPLEFFQSLSMGSLHHLAQVGQLLGDAIQPPISAWRYLEVRNILLILVEFLEKIESTRHSPSCLSSKLHRQIREIDRLM
ncbi:hypothetical protein BO86DRAFT_426937, partial [Aspergillus japonicus CBS 114.51]